MIKSYRQVERDRPAKLNNTDKEPSILDVLSPARIGAANAAAVRVALQVQTRGAEPTPKERG
jgi:hypothetical protein